jgi:short-subunit dehydrogenase
VAYTALVTGASSGIGKDLARLFAADGHDVVLVARRLDALEALAAELTSQHRVTATPIAADLAEARAPEALFDAVRQRSLAVDVVVNCAGFGLHGTIAELPLDRQLAMIQVNVAALTALTRLFVPAMLERNRGGVLNVASLAAFSPGPLMAVYYATKAYVVSFTEALADEVRESALKVSCLCPSATLTEFAQASGMTESKLFSGATMTSIQVAREGYDGWKAGRILVAPGTGNKIAMTLMPRLPRALVRRWVRGFNSPR